MLKIKIKNMSKSSKRMSFPLQIPFLPSCHYQLPQAFSFEKKREDHSQKHDVPRRKEVESVMKLLYFLLTSIFKRIYTNVHTLK